VDDKFLHRVGDLVKFDQWYPSFGGATDAFRTWVKGEETRQRRYRDVVGRLKTGDLGLVMARLSSREAWVDLRRSPDNFDDKRPNCYVVYWFSQKEKALVYETETIPQENK
jgi:hypothetical protein